MRALLFAAAFLAVPPIARAQGAIGYPITVEPKPGFYLTALLREPPSSSALKPTKSQGARRGLLSIALTEPDR